ncbi:hypothetical protein SAFG77S_11612 [Streptomyces afghaniensis]
MNTLKDKYGIFERVKMTCVPDSMFHGYYSDEKYFELTFPFTIELKKYFDYIGLGLIESYGYDLYNLNELETRFDDSSVDIAIESLDPFKSEVHMTIAFNGYGHHLDTLNGSELKINLIILGKRRIESSLPLWKELLYSFYFLYENENYRASFVQLFTCLESYLESLGANPNDKVEPKLKYVLGNYLSKSTNYKEKFYELRRIRNTLAHGSAFNFSKRHVHELFKFFDKTYDKSIQIVD